MAEFTMWQYSHFWVVGIENPGKKLEYCRYLDKTKAQADLDQLTEKGFFKRVDTDRKHKQRITKAKVNKPIAKPLIKPIPIPTVIIPKKPTRYAIYLKSADPLVPEGYWQGRDTQRKGILKPLTTPTIDSQTKSYISLAKAEYALNCLLEKSYHKPITGEIKEA